MLLRKYVSLLKIAGKFELKRIKYYKIDYVINLFGKVMFLLTNLLFWRVLSNIGYELKGWEYKDITVFIAFSELFYGLENAVFSMSSRFWRYIYSGNLECGLVRPVDTRIRFLLLNVDFVGLICTIIEFVAILLICHINQSVLCIIAGVILVLCSNIVLSLIRLCMSYTAFWHGRMDAISEFADSLNTFNKYPLVIMPKPVILIFKILLPFYFFSTFEAELVRGMMDAKILLTSLAMFVICLLFWICINNVIWRRGLERYEGING